MDYWMYKNSLAHFGILGQKWGVRRYQNRDGSLTPEGRARYLSGEGAEDIVEGLANYNKNSRGYFALHEAANSTGKLKEANDNCKAAERSFIEVGERKIKEKGTEELYNEIEKELKRRADSYRKEKDDDDDYDDTFVYLGDLYGSIRKSLFDKKSIEKMNSALEKRRQISEDVTNNIVRDLGDKTIKIEFGKNDGFAIWGNKSTAKQLVHDIIEYETNENGRWTMNMFIDPGDMSDDESYLSEFDFEGKSRTLEKFYSDCYDRLSKKGYSFYD